MCVQQRNQSWERPVAPSDFPIIAEHFPGISYAKLYDAMTQDEAVPLCTDLVLVGAMFHAKPDDIGVRLVKFSGADPATDEVVKIPAMDGVVGWFENSALGTDMWQNANRYLSTLGYHVHFAMKCSCGLVPIPTKHNGAWSEWQRAFNRERAHVYGRTNISWRPFREGDGLSHDDALLWDRIVRALQALPSEPSLT